MQITDSRPLEPIEREAPRDRFKPAPQIRFTGLPSNRNLLHEQGLAAKAAALNTNEGASLVWREVAEGAPSSPAEAPASPAGAPTNPFRADSPQPLEGYDSNKLNNPEHRTPKYIFGRVAQNYKLDSVKGDKSRAEELLKSMVPELQAAGLEVVGVSGDRIQVKTEVGYEWVDVVRGAGGDNPGWWWGSEGKGTPQPTATVQQWAAATGQASPGAPAAAGAAMRPPVNPVLGSQIDEAAVKAILQKHPPTPEGVKAAVAELQPLYPGVHIIEHPKQDKLLFPNGAIIDVVVNAGATDGTAPSWGWGMEN